MTTPTVSPLNALAIALKDELKKAPLSLPVRASRGYRPRFLLQELLDEVQLVCTPAGQDKQGEDRSHSRSALSVHIGILKKLKPESTDGPDEGFEENLTELDALMGLVNEIVNLFMPDDNGVCHLETSIGPVYATTVSNEVAYDLAHLEQHRQFTSVVTVEFQLWKGGR